MRPQGQRQAIYEKRLRGEPRPWTKNRTLQTYKFTCPFRAADRTTQYLIKEVIYEGGSMVPEELFFRVILFKLFNKIETWQRLTAALGSLTWKGFALDTYGAVLDEAIARKKSVFTVAYMQRPQTVPTGQREVDGGKHYRYLDLLRRLMKDQMPRRLQMARTYQDAYGMLRNFGSPAIGPFAAMQWLTDLNYSPVINFSENDFIMPGPGALDGINKCFGLSLGPRDDRTAAQYIKDCVDEQDGFFEHYGLPPATLYGRKLHLIDCQNLFCEVDKFSRVEHPDLNLARSEIKQTFTPTGQLPKPYFPLKWGLDTSKVP